MMDTPRKRTGETGDSRRWTWKNYRWNPGAKGGQRIDPENIKGTGIAFDKRDRAVLPESEREAYEKWMDELADPKGEWELEDGRKVKVRSELVPKNWRTNKEFDRDYDYVRAYLAGKKDPELARMMVGPVWHDKEVRENGEVVPEGYWLHMNDVGKMPTHPTFSTDSLYTKDPELARKYIKLAGSWSGEEYIPGEAERSVQQDSKGGDAGQGSETAVAGTGRNRVPVKVSAPLTGAAKRKHEKEQLKRVLEERERNRPRMGARDPRFRPLDEQRTTLPALLASKLPTGSSRDAARMVLHGLARTGNTILRFIDIPNRVFGNTRSVLQDIYERSEANLAKDAYEDQSGAPQAGETAVHLASGGVLGKALPSVFGANTGVDMYETAKYAGASEGEALAKSIGHGVVDTAIWTLGQGLASKYLPKAWQWLGREIIGAGRGAASSVTTDAVLNSLGADISGDEMAKRAVHAAWMVPLLGMLKMGGKRREEAMTLLRKARPDLAGVKADKVIETIEAEFSDPKSQKVALAWVARKGANLPDDTAQIRQALEVSSKVKGLDPTSKSPFEILSDPAYARYLPKPKPQDVKAFSNMKRYPMGVIGFDVSDNAAGRQATREMINAYMSPSSNPWCLATGKDAAKLGELGPGAEGYWNSHSAVPKQIFFQEVNGKLELTAFRATSPGGEGHQEYWDTSDAGYSGIPLKVKVPGDPMGRYQKMVFKPSEDGKVDIRGRDGELLGRGTIEDMREFLRDHPEGEQMTPKERIQLQALRDAIKQNEASDVRGTFEDVAPGILFKGDPFRDGRSQKWVSPHGRNHDITLTFEMENFHEGRYVPSGRYENIHYTRDELVHQIDFWERKGISDRAQLGREALARYDRGERQYILTEDKVRTTENGITKFRTTKYDSPTDWDYKPLKPGEQPKPVEIEESELINPEWMRARGYDPESESDVRRMQEELDIQAWGNGAEAAMAVVPTKRTFIGVRKDGSSETITYGPDGHEVRSVDFEENGVPYREEYFNAGRYANQVPQELRSSGIDVTGPISAGNRRSGYSDVRLIRNPDGADASVVSETRFDENLGTFVRTVGNRRSYVAGQDISNEEHQRATAYEDAIVRRLNEYDAGEGAYPAELPDGTVVMTRDQVRNLARVLRVADAAHVRRYSRPSYDFPMLAAFSENFPDAAAGIMSDLPTIRNGKIQTDRVLRVEDRQPDGTWTLVETREPVRDSKPDDDLREPDPADVVFEPDGDDLPFALKAGRTRRDIRAAEGGGDAGSETAVSEPPVSGGAPAPQDGPRIVINPTVFEDEKDALCVAYNEAFRIVMEVTGFDPVSQPTDAQRGFFSDTAYSRDENQMRRTILARICTFDTSVKDPTDEQLQEAVEFLHSVLEAGFPQTTQEQAIVQRILDVLSRIPMGQNPGGSGTPPVSAPQAGAPEARGDVSGGVADVAEYEERSLTSAGGAILTDPETDAQGPAFTMQNRQRERELL